MFDLGMTEDAGKGRHGETETRRLKAALVRCVRFVRLTAVRMFPDAP